MSWFRLDDEMPWHPKIALAGGDAAWLWVCAGCYSAKHELNGRVPKSIMGQLTDRKQPNRLCGRLVAAGLLEDAGDYFVVHDYLDFNPSADEVAARRRARSKAGKVGGKRSGESRRSKQASISEAPAEAFASANGNQPGSGKASENEPRTPNSEADASDRRGYTKGQRDPIFAAIVSVFGEAKTRTTQAFYGRAVTELLDAGATADEVATRGARLKKKNWPDSTVAALLKHWTTLGAEPTTAVDAVNAMSRGRA
jgi:hypothetical protein